VAGLTEGIRQHAGRDTRGSRALHSLRTKKVTHDPVTVSSVAVVAVARCVQGKKMVVPSLANPAGPHRLAVHSEPSNTLRREALTIRGCGQK